MYPSGVAQAAKFAAALIKWARAGLPTRTPEEIEERLVICQACPHFDGKQERCRKCGCCLGGQRSGWRNKLAYATEECPIGKW